jgi:hypothetical protein
MEREKTILCSIVIEVPARTTIPQCQTLLDKIRDDRNVLNAKFVVETITKPTLNHFNTEGNAE